MLKKKSQKKKRLKMVNFPGQWEKPVASCVTISMIDKRICIATPDGSDSMSANDIVDCITPTITCTDSGQLLFGVNGKTSPIAIKTIAGKIALEDLKNVADGKCQDDCAILTFRVGTDGEDGKWSPYNPPEATNVVEMAGFNAEGCLVKLKTPGEDEDDDTCFYVETKNGKSEHVSIKDKEATSKITNLLALDENGCIVPFTCEALEAPAEDEDCNNPDHEEPEEQETASDYKRTLCINPDGTTTCECAPYKTIEESADYKTELAGIPGVYQGPGEVQDDGGTEIDMVCSRTVTNNTDCPKLVTYELTMGVCVIGEEFPLEVVPYAYIDSSGGTTFGPSVPGGNRTIETQHCDPVEGAPVGSGFVSKYIKVKAQVKLQPGESTEFTAGGGYQLYAGTVTDMVNIVGYDNTLPDGNGVVAPILTCEKCD